MAGAVGRLHPSHTMHHSGYAPQPHIPPFHFWNNPVAVALVVNLYSYVLRTHVHDSESEI